MSKTRISRKRLLQGFGLSAIAGALGITPGRASASQATRAHGGPLPQGFSYAAGNAPQIQPVKEVRGRIASVDDTAIVVRAGKTDDVVPLSSKPFIWKNGIVYPARAASRLRVGEAVTIDGVADAHGVFLDIQHVWVT